MLFFHYKTLKSYLMRLPKRVRFENEFIMDFIMKHTLKNFTLTVALLFSTPAWADTNPNQICPITYEVFEDEVSHIDLAECPDNKPDTDAGFCRLIFDGDKAFIYIFVYTQDDACLNEIVRAEKSEYLMKR